LSSATDASQHFCGREAANYEQHCQRVTDCEQREAKLTVWERGFIDSISQQLNNGRPLTDKQAETLDSIWERVT
jgi:hypothetical protein